MKQQRRAAAGAGEGAALLLGLQLRRWGDVLRRPRAGAWIGVLLPLAAVVASLWMAGPWLRPNTADPQGRVLLGLLVSAPPALGAYGVLFRADDDALLRRLGVSAGARYVERSLRLLLISLGATLLTLVPFLASGQVGRGSSASALAAAFAAWGASLFASAGAARRIAAPTARLGVIGAIMRPYDPALARAAPLVTAPLLPLLAGVAAAAAAGAASASGAWLAASLGAGVLLGVAAAGPFAEALPRFAPRAAEMAFAPLPEAGTQGLAVGRGLARLLPQRAGAVRARDAVVVARRFRWAGRATAPVAVVSVLLLLRAGDRASVQEWVAGVGALLLLLQGVAVVSLGRLERGSLRWMDRALGLGWMDRLVGRWALGFGLALGLVLPVAITWELRAGAGDPSGWLWIAGAAATAAVAAAASVAAAGR